MEDAHAAVLELTAKNPSDSSDRVSFFAVYDGHGGKRAAVFAGENLHNIVAIQDAFTAKNYPLALKDGFLSTDRSLLADREFEQDPSGCTATTALVTDNKIFVANSGDSRTVLGVKGIAKPLSFDHKPQNEGEKARICAAGGFVEDGRVNGNLALSRAIGDFEFKRSPTLPPEEQVVTVCPDIMEHDITPDDEFLVLACDGIWDCLDSQAVVEFVRRGIVEGQELSFICENIMDHCLAPESDMTGIGCDNMTMMIVALLNGKTKEEWYQSIKDRVANGEGPVGPVELAAPKASLQSARRAEEPRYDDAQQQQDGSSSALAIMRLLEESGVMDENGRVVIKPELASTLFKLTGGAGAESSAIEAVDESANDDNDDDDKSNEKK